MTPTRYPLQWPLGWKRTPDYKREPGRFGKRELRPGRSYASTEDVTIAQACQRLLTELGRMAVREGDIVISTNVRTRLDGLPYSNERAPTDPGAAVYWRDALAIGGPQDRCMAIDRYTKVEQNIAALAATIEAMRSIERHGGATILDRAFTGFTALPAPIVAGMKRHWTDVLDLQRHAALTREEIDQRYRRLAAEHHPDRGGDAAKMAEINAARDEALRDLTA